MWPVHKGNRNEQDGGQGKPLATLAGSGWPPRTLPSKQAIRLQNEGSEKLSSLSKVTERASERTRTGTSLPTLVLTLTCPHKAMKTDEQARQAR